ncbi:unnamed protein product [Acanthoscelides obtectus]|uniref:Rapamycin-insensitive companion of mTOR n=1 Tax=Acanthoscelides obtectus TaxID=200917 RepID=A0A9P0JQ34_ACAOB|nr:unnamed protein product [Acanthoscelides obtectus]CAK1621266.1 Rapamycin-insensitive companion of mTOR [Acanthoscelides obtectus]
MAMSSWINIRSGRIYRSTKQSKQEDVLASLSDLEPHECCKRLLAKVCQKDVEERSLYNYLNAFAKFYLKYENDWEKVGWKTEELLYCLRIPLVHESSQIRTVGLRCIRLLLKTENDVAHINKLLIPFLIVRSVDLILGNDVERIEAMRLMRNILIIAPAKFDIAMARCMVSLAFDGAEAKDRMLRVCLATLSDLGVLNPKLLIISGGVTAISRNLLECQTPKIAESLCGVLLLLLDKPQTRHYAAVDLHCAAAPFCDFHYKHGTKDKNKRDERELRLNCGRLALLTILRSWSGILHFCSPNDRSGFKAIVDVLYLKQLEVRKSVLDLLYDLLGLPQPEWSDELSVALSAADPCEPQASWRLNEGFVVAEGRSVLPHLAAATPTTADMHLALLLYCFLENGLLAALAEVIATSDTFICVRASVLLGEILRLIQILLPPGCCNISPSLPTLLDYASKSKPQAIAAITALEQLHMLMKRRPASYSLHLDYIIRNSYHKRMEHKQEKNVRHKSALKSKIQQLVLKDGEDPVKETGVLASNDAFTWDWNLINLLLKAENNSKIDFTDSSHRTFVKKLIEFYMPSKNKYSHMDLGTSKSSIIYTTAGIELIKFLVELKDTDYSGLRPRLMGAMLAMDLFQDILNNIEAVMTSRSVHDCLFSPQHMVSTQCQSYFLFIGQFARNVRGLKMLEGINMFQKLKQLATTTNHDCYVKLIISSMEYIFPGPCRDILEAVLTCNSDSSRLYATQFLHVLLRARNPLFSTWAIQLLVNQLSDKSRSVVLSALSTLHEACELPDCLEALININPDLEKLGEKGSMLFVRFLSTESGYNKIIHDSSKDKIISELKRWDEHLIYRYVKVVETDLSDALTLHQRNEEGRYDKRVSNLRSSSKRDVFLPPHIYGQLNQHIEGYELLICCGRTEKMIEVIKSAKCTTDEQILHLKACIWAVSHLGTSNRGFEYLTSYGIVDNIILLAKKCPVYSIRATAFYALGLLGTTPIGADELSRKGWLCTRHDRHDYWPIIKEEIQDSFYTNSSVSTSEDVISLDNPFVGEFENLEDDDDDDVDPEESQDAVSSPIYSPESRKLRQSTLPPNRRPPAHKRSLSESKTFDTSNGYDDDNRLIIMGRHRNSSMTESTTSGVSSCDSLANKHGTCVNYSKTLSPIPSSSSLSTLQLPPTQIRRVSHRISSNSTTNSDISSSSQTGSASNELSMQNMVGYNTLKWLRWREAFNLDKPNYEEDYLFKTTLHLAPTTPTLIDDFQIVDTSVSTAFGVAKFDVESTTPARCDRRYMGICLPKVLLDLFPPQEEILREPKVFPESLSTSECEGIDPEGESIKSKSWRHWKRYCFYCSRLDGEGDGNKDERITDESKLEVLKNVERIANPISNKYVRAHLIRFKQKEPDTFRDICIYSEVCKIMSEGVYRLPTRRVLHELFLDVCFDELYDIPVRLLGTTMEIKEEPPATPESDRQRNSISSDISSPTESLKTLDSLNLTFKENKFPIKH